MDVQPRPFEFFRERAGVGSGLRVVDGIGPHGLSDAGPKDAGFAARRGAEREAPGGKPALCGVRAAHYAEYLSGWASVFVDGDRGYGRPERGGHGRREGMVQDLLRAVERGDRDGGRYRPEDREGEGGKILREYSRGPAGGSSASLGGEDDGNASADRPGSRSPGADL